MTQSDTAAPAWPDANNPGVPLNPQRDGWHWLSQGDEAMPWHWSDDQGAEGDFGWETDDDLVTPERMAREFSYLGPCLTPSEVAASVAAAERRGIERARELLEPQWVWHSSDFASLLFGRVELAQVSKGSTEWFWYLRHTQACERASYSDPEKATAMQVAEAHARKVLAPRGQP